MEQEVAFAALLDTVVAGRSSLARLRLARQRQP